MSSQTFIELLVQLKKFPDDYIWQALPWSYCTTNNRILSVKFEIKPMFRRTNSNTFKSDSCAPVRMPNPIILGTWKF